MVAVHNAALEQLRRTLLPDQPLQVIDSLSNRATRLLRLYVDQLAMRRDAKSRAADRLEADLTEPRSTRSRGHHGLFLLEGAARLPTYGRILRPGAGCLRETRRVIT